MSATVLFFCCRTSTICRRALSNLLGTPPVVLCRLARNGKFRSFELSMVVLLKMRPSDCKGIWAIMVLSSCRCTGLPKYGSTSCRTRKLGMSLVEVALLSSSESASLMTSAAALSLTSAVAASAIFAAAACSSGLSAVAVSCTPASLICTAGGVAAAAIFVAAACSSGLSAAAVSCTPASQFCFASSCIITLAARFTCSACSCDLPAAISCTPALQFCTLSAAVAASSVCSSACWSAAVCCTPALTCCSASIFGMLSI